MDDVDGRGAVGDQLAMRTLVVAAAVAYLLQPVAASAQSLTTEATVTSGYSSDEIAASATQVRAFGEATAGIRFFGEVAWASSSDDDSDAFGAAYPYGGRVQVIEAYGERVFRPRDGIVAVRAGRFRPPFGIYSGSDHAYTGYLRAPLIRYDGYFALSNTFLEHGADLVVGVPRLTVETSVGVPADVGNAIRRSGTDTVVRVQSFGGPVIVGVSHVRTSPYQPARFARGRSRFTGIDVRWMREGVQFRGEWIGGRPFDGTTTTGWYADWIVHRVAMGPITAVARIERLDYEAAPPRALHSTRQTLGGRIRLFEGLSAQVNVVHSAGVLEAYRPTAMDVGVTYSLRRRF